MSKDRRNGCMLLCGTESTRVETQHSRYSSPVVGWLRTLFQIDAEPLKLPQEAQEKLSENLTPSWRSDTCSVQEEVKRISALDTLMSMYTHTLTQQNDVMLKKKKNKNPNPQTKRTEQQGDSW